MRNGQNSTTEAVANAQRKEQQQRDQEAAQRNDRRATMRDRRAI